MAITLSILNGCQFLTDFHNRFTAEKPGKLPKNPYITSTIPSVCYRTTLRKLEVRVLAYLVGNADENVTYSDFSTHTPNFNAFNVLTYLLFQFPVPVKHAL